MAQWMIDRYKRQRLFLILVAMVWLMAACGPLVETATPTPILVDPGPAECDQRVPVMVWGDLNEDGIQDPDEPTLENVQLMITTTEDPTEDGLQLRTSEDGKVHFPTRELENCQTAGYQVLFLRQVAGYAFPVQPVVNLDNFDPLHDTVSFGLLPESESGD